MSQSLIVCIHKRDIMRLSYHTISSVCSQVDQLIDCAQFNDLIKLIDLYDLIATYILKRRR